MWYSRFCLDGVFPQDASNLQVYQAAADRGFTVVFYGYKPSIPQKPWFSIEAAHQKVSSHRWEGTMGL